MIQKLSFKNLKISSKKSSSSKSARSSKSCNQPKFSCSSSSSKKQDDLPTSNNDDDSTLIDNQDNEMNGILLTRVNENTTDIYMDESQLEGLNGNNCEIVLYPGCDVMHLKADDNKIIIKRHDINKIYPCCQGINHKEFRQLYLETELEN